MSARAALVASLAGHLSLAGLAIAINPGSPYYAVYADAYGGGAVSAWGVVLVVLGLALYGAWHLHTVSLVRTGRPGRALFAVGLVAGFAFVSLAVAFLYESLVTGRPVWTTRQAALWPAAAAAFFVASWGCSPWARDRDGRPAPCGPTRGPRPGER